MSISKQLDQASHGEYLCIVDAGSNVIARTPGCAAIDHLTADQIVERWNAHNALVDALLEAERMVDAQYRNNPMPDDLAALGRIRAALAKVMS